MIEKLPLEKLVSLICKLPNTRLYGEAVESLVDGQGGNFITIDEKEFCSINDSFDAVVFFIRNSANADTTQAGGRNNLMTRKVSYTMAINCKSNYFELDILSFINTTSGLEYQSTSYDNKANASRYFGLDDYNFEGYFVSIEFTALERITCAPRCRQ